MLKRKPHYVEVTLSSVSKDYVNQEIIFREYANDAPELVKKNFAIADTVIPNLFAKMRELAAPFLKKGK